MIDGPIHRIFTEKTHRAAPYLYIGKVAEITGASRKAIRLYESLGLIPTPARRGKYRIYSERDLFLIHMIKHGQSFGFRLKELKELTAATVQANRFPLKRANDLFERKRAELRDEIDALRRLDRRLVKLKEEMNRTFR